MRHSKTGFFVGVRHWRSLALAAIAAVTVMPNTAHAGADSKPEIVCLPLGDARPEVYEIRPGTYSVRGPLAPFDPCHESVQLSVPGQATKPPLMILVHGGGGGKDNDGTYTALRGKGIALLAFDAYRMNGFTQNSRFWALQATYEARQRMIYTTAKAAYDWAKGFRAIDTSRIYIYGLSNGADVVANLAAIADPAHVRMVFAEGIAGAGLGLPDTLRVPLRAIFGRLDNFGAISGTDWRWRRSNPCQLNHPDFPRPPGNAAQCNMRTNPTSRTESPESWIARQKAAGANIETWFYERAAHGIFLGPLNIRTNTWGSGVVAHANVGAEPVAQEQLLTDLLAVITQP